MGWLLDRFFAENPGVLHTASRERIRPNEVNLWMLFSPSWHTDFLRAPVNLKPLPSSCTGTLVA